MCDIWATFIDVGHVITNPLIELAIYDYILLYANIMQEDIIMNYIAIVTQMHVMIMINGQ